MCNWLGFICVLLYLVHVKSELVLINTKPVENSTKIKSPSKGPVIIIKGINSGDSRILAVRKKKNLNNGPPKERLESKINIDNVNNPSYVQNEEAVLTDRFNNITIEGTVNVSSIKTIGKSFGDTSDEVVNSLESSVPEFNTHNYDIDLRTVDIDRNYKKIKEESSKEKSEYLDIEFTDTVNNESRTDENTAIDDEVSSSEIDEDFHLKSGDDSDDTELTEIRNIPGSFEVPDNGNLRSDNLASLETIARSGDSFNIDDDDFEDSNEKQNDEGTGLLEDMTVPLLRNFDHNRVHNQAMYPTVIPTILGPRVIFQPIPQSVNVQRPIYLSPQPSRLLRDFNQIKNTGPENLPSMEGTYPSETFRSNIDATYPYGTPSQNDLDAIRQFLKATGSN